MAEKPASNVRRLRVVVGRSKVAGPSIVDLAREKAAACIDILATIAADTTITASSRISAATALIDRGWGRPVAMTIGESDAEEFEEGEISLEEILAARAEILDDY